MPYGTSGTVSEATTALALEPLTGCAYRSGEPVAPTRPFAPAPWELNASIVMGTEDCAVNCTLLTSVGRMKSVQDPGIVIGPPGALHAVGSPFCSFMGLTAASRASAKYHSPTAPLLVTVTGIVTALPACSFRLVELGRPLAVTCAVLKPIRAENGSEVWLPEAK